MALLLADLKVFLPDLLGKKRPLLEPTNTGKTYLPLLEQQLAAIDALPPSVDAGTPLADDLAKRDAEHDGFGAAAWFMVEAYARCPGASDQQRAAAVRIRTHFIPKLSELQATFVTEASRARTRKALLAAHEADLTLFPVAGGGTLLDWVTAYLDAGIGLSELLSDRADMPLDSRAGAGTLRTKTLGILARMRGALSDEVQTDKSLPRDLEAQVFAFMDQLEATRRAPKKAAKPTPASPASPASPPSEDPPNG